MGSTKIIHVLKNDGFEEVFDLFKNTEASEIIFIFPKGSRFAKSSQHFTAVKREAENSGKQVSIMTADPIVAQFASQNDLDLIQMPEPKKREKPTLSKEVEPIAAVAEAPSYYEEDNNEPEAQLAVAPVRKPAKIIKDILKPNIERPFKVKEERIKQFDVDITHDTPSGKNRTGDIAEVWASQNRDDRIPFNPTRSIRQIKSSKIFRKTPLLFAGSAIIVLLLILYSILGNAKVIITPQKQALNFQIKASASSTATTLNFDFSRIPGQRFSYKDEASGTFPATGQKEVVQKANGKITIYNKGPSPQRLVATTRFESPDGLVFRIPQTVEVPPATGSGVSFKEGSITSLVYADKAGAEYNIGSTTFVIPGFEDTPKFEQFYAKSSQPMAGGIIGPSKVATEEDFVKAQETVMAKLKEKILSALKDQAGELKILDSIEIKFESPGTNAKVGEAIDALEMTIKGIASTMAFRESDPLELVKNYVAQKDDLELLSKDLKISYRNPQNNADGSVMTFEIDVSGTAAAKIDQEKILKEITGLKDEAIRSYFKSIKEVESARITLSPFWVKSIPKDPGRVKLIIEKE